MSENWEHFDQCFDDLVQAKKLFSGVFVGPDLLGKLLAVFSILQTERPECLAWFYSNLCVMNIDQRYQSVIDDAQSSEERRRFAKENLGLHYLQQGDFQKAAALFRDLAHSNTACKKYFAQSVIQNEHRSIDDLIECLEVDNCDAAHIILEQFEMAKNAQEVDKALLKRNISTVVHKELFFTRYHYEICAKIELVFEKRFHFDSSKLFLTNFMNTLIQASKLHITHSHNTTTFHLLKNGFPFLHMTVLNANAKNTST